MAFPLKAYHRNPQKVAAGRIGKVYYDEDNEEVPFIVWINDVRFSLHEGVCEERDPQVGDYLVIPVDGKEPRYEDAAILTSRMFHLLYAERNAKSAEAATSIAPDIH